MRGRSLHSSTCMRPPQWRCSAPRLRPENRSRLIFCEIGEPRGAVRRSAGSPTCAIACQPPGCCGEPARGVSLLSLERVTARLGPEPVLSSVDFEIAEGELVGVFVRVQAGRATLLRVASGLEEPEQGRVLFDGRPVVPSLVLG